MSKNNIAYHHFAAAAATIVSPLPSPAMALNDGANPWANIGTSTTSSSSPTSTSTTSSTSTSQPSSGAKGQQHLATPSVVYSNSTQPTLVSIMDGSIQPKNVINDVFLSSTMLCDDVELYLNESSSSNFDSDSDSGFSTPSTHDDDSHFSTPMTPMSPFLENDDEDLYHHEGEDEQPEEEEQDNKQASSSIDLADMVVDMKRPMFIPVSICDPRDFAAMASLPTPPECNARKHSYDFLRNSDAFMLGGISSTKRRRMLSVDMMSSSEAPASPPASNAGDDEVAELSDADSSASSYMARRRSLFQMRNVRHLTPTSPSMPEIFCFAPPTHEEYDYHPELDHSDDEDEEEEEEEDDDDRVQNTRMMEPSMVSSYVRDVVASGLFVIEDQEGMNHISYMSDDNYSSSDDEGEVGYHSEDEMHVDDAMSSSDESDSDLSDVEEYQFPVRRRGTWHGPSLEAIEAAAEEGKPIVAPKPEARPSHKVSKKKEESKKHESKTKTKVESTPVVAPVASPAPPKKASSCDVKSTKTPTLFQILTKANIDWCRYCGTTEGVNWRPGPWGKRTLCNKHGCDFKGYGFACKLPRLDLTSYAHETVDQRIRPVLQHFCHGCQSQESAPGNVMIRCEGCPKAFHQQCHGETLISDEVASSDKAWFCDDNCRENVKKRRVCVELPKKRLPLMSTPKPTGSAAGTAEPSPSSPRPRVRASVSGESPSRAK
ncbi:hypothetical protein CPB97_005052 [Podila verticillata]|nr:hypothetical protein CPB97_005052 [Podila verticillata]